MNLLTLRLWKWDFGAAMAPFYIPDPLTTEIKTA
jgi:hypothetical protein